MTTLHWIETLMFSAFIFYVFAFFAKGSKHKIFAIIGFSLDMYGTYLMGEMKNWSFLGDSLLALPSIHTILSLLAVLAFLTQLYFGIKKDVERHIWFAKFVFFPIWGLSFITGAFMAHGLGITL